jgi:hypothetical protein
LRRWADRSLRIEQSIAAFSESKTPLAADLRGLPIAGRSIEMSSVGLALIRTASVSQEFAQEPPPSSTPTSPYQDPLIGGSTPNSLPPNIPEDTVTISNTRSPSRPPQNESANDVLGGVLGGANSAAPEAARAAAGHDDLLNAKPNSNRSAVNSAQVSANGDPKSLNTTAAQPSSVNAQEQLQELDRTLQQLGINPESVSLIRRVELLRLANDPAALQQYFQSSPSTAAQGSRLSSTTANPASLTEIAVPTSANSPAAATPPPKSTGYGNRLNVSA